MQSLLNVSPFSPHSNPQIFVFPADPTPDKEANPVCVFR